MASLNDAPSNLHQVTAVTLLDPDAGGERKVRYCCASFFVVFLQMAAVLGVYLGVEKPSCLKSADCARGDFCLPEGRCNQCWWGAYLLCDDGSVVADEGQVLNSVCPSGGQKLNAPAGSIQFHDDNGTVVFGPLSGVGEDQLMDQLLFNARYFCSASRPWSLTEAEQQFCEGCFDEDLPGNHWNKGREEDQAVVEAVSMMKAGDWLALVMVSIVTGLYIAGEIRVSPTFEHRTPRRWCSMFALIVKQDV